VATLLLLYMAALAVRTGVGLAFPGAAYLDSFYYVDVARQLAAGHGLSVPFIWAYLEVGGHIPSHGVLPVPSNAHWLPLASLVQVPFIWLLGPVDVASQLPFWLLGATLSPLTWLIGRDAGLPRWVSAGAAVLMAVPGGLTPFMSQPDNFSLYGPLGAAALWACARGLRGQRRSFVVGGLLVGMASLARNDGVLLGVPFALAFLVERWRSARAGRGLTVSGPIGWPAAFGCAALFAVVMTPWWTRQILVFGTAFPSAATGRVLWISTYTQLFSTVGTPTLGSLVAQGMGPFLLSRVGGFAAAVGLFAYLPFAVALAPLFVIGAWLHRRDVAFGPWLTYGLTLLSFSTLLFAVHVPSGNFIHSAVALVPHAYLLMLAGLGWTVGWIARRRPTWRPESATRVFAGGAIVVVALFGWASSVQTVRQWSAYRAGLDPIVAQLATLPPSDVVMSGDPAGIWDLSGHPGIVTPADPLPFVERAARSYGARWLVLDVSGLVPSLAPVLSGQTLPSWLSRPIIVVGPASGGGSPTAAMYAVCLSAEDARCH
jgi:ABC-type glycerol-3-phosphate transport system permease component